MFKKINVQFQCLYLGLCVCVCIWHMSQIRIMIIELVFLYGSYSVGFCATLVCKRVYDDIASIKICKLTDSQVMSAIYGLSPFISLYLCVSASPLQYGFLTFHYLLCLCLSVFLSPLLLRRNFLSFASSLYIQTAMHSITA